MEAPRAQRSRLLLALAVVVGAVLMTGVIRWMRRPRQRPTTPEMKANLLALYTMERAYFDEKDAYTEDLRTLGFQPLPGNRYTYFAAASGHYQIAPADPEAEHFRGAFSSFAKTGCPLTPGTMPDGGRAGLGVTFVSGPPPRAIFIGAAAANLDDDATVDCWSIATVERVSADGEHIPPGVPYNEVNDVVR